MGLTAKPGRATGLIALVLYCASSPLAAMGSAFYSREVHTTHHLSAGCSVEDGVYFLSAYRLYRSPRGIARFPDGGRARYLLQQTHLYRYIPETGQLQQLLLLSDQHHPGGNVRNSYCEPHGNTLRLVYQQHSGSRDQSEAWHAAAWDLRQQRALPIDERTKRDLLDRFHYDHESPWGISALRAVLADKTLQQWNLISPLEYTSKSDAAYSDDLVALRGDQHYRNAIVEAIADGRIAADATEILARMAARLDLLEEPARSAYELFGRKTRAALQAVLRFDDGTRTKPE